MKILDNLLKHHPEDVYSFNMFSTDYCYKLSEELEHFQRSKMPKERPNSMNNYGVKGRNKIIVNSTYYPSSSRFSWMNWVLMKSS